MIGYGWGYQPWGHPHTHTHTPTHIHTHIHTRTYTHTHIQRHMKTHWEVHTEKFHPNMPRWTWQINLAKVVPLLFHSLVASFQIRNSARVQRLVYGTRTIFLWQTTRHPSKLHQSSIAVEWSFPVFHSSKAVFIQAEWLLGFFFFSLFGGHSIHWMNPVGIGCEFQSLP